MRRASRWRRWFQMATWRKVPWPPGPQMAEAGISPREGSAAGDGCAVGRRGRFREAAGRADAVVETQAGPAEGFRGRTGGEPRERAAPLTGEARARNSRGISGRGGSVPEVHGRGTSGERSIEHAGSGSGGEGERRAHHQLYVEKGDGGLQAGGEVVRKDPVRVPCPGEVRWSPALDSRQPRDHRVTSTHDERKTGEEGHQEGHATG